MVYHEKVLESSRIADYELKKILEKSKGKADKTEVGNKKKKIGKKKKREILDIN